MVEGHFIEHWDRLLFRDYLIEHHEVATVPKMHVLTRADALGVVRSGRMHFERYETAGLRVRVYSDSGITMGRLHGVRNVDGKMLDDEWQFTKVYVRRGAQWSIVAFHALEAPR